MAIQTIPGGFWIPRPYNTDTGISLTYLASMTNAAGKVAIIFRAPKTGNIHKVMWGTRTVTTGATVDVRLETVDLTTAPVTPSGTLWGTNTRVSRVVNSTDDNVVFLDTLTADAAVTRGDLIAFVVANASPGSMTVPTCLAMTGLRASSFPFGTSFNGTSWGANITGYLPMLSLEYDDGSYDVIDGVYPAASAVDSITLNTISTPDVGGLRFQFPFPVRVSGAWAQVASSIDYKIRLVTTAYNQSTSAGVLTDLTIDKDSRVDNPGILYYRFPSPQSLSANTYYRLIIEPTVSGTLTLAEIQLQSLAHMDSWEGGRNFHSTTAKDPTSDADWTNYNSGSFRAPFMGLYIDGFDDGASGGGSGESSSVFS